ncbi:tetratricopeptide repeat protein [Vibrio rarus]|uniref:tetratricopeptide repeat protein n=1 Tax=Vibrio rarus TaxID=413403 RepID=UPI0021C256D6|nr:hypothetical protein [Vibrio rarus]
MTPHFLYRQGYDLLTKGTSATDKSLAIKYLFQSSSLKHPEALYAFGRLYIDGDYVEKNESTGVRYLEDAHALGIVAASFELSLLQYENATDEGAELTAYREIKRLAEGGYKPAALWLNDELLELSECFLYGDAVFPSKHKAQSLLVQAVEEKLVVDITLLEEYMLNFDDFPISFYHAVEKLKLEVLSSDELVDIANRYLESASSHIRSKAITLFKRAAENDDEYGLLGMAKCYQEGIGCPVNDLEANRLYRILADEYSISEAAFKLAERLDEEVGIDISFELSAFYYFCKAASFGSEEAAYRAYEILETDPSVVDGIISSNLFHHLDCYDENLDINCDEYNHDRLKLKLLDIASQGENTTAHFQFAESINELLWDTSQATKHYRFAADSGHAQAAYEYALHLEKEGKDRLAHKYFCIAAENDIDKAFYNVAWNLYNGEVCKKDISGAEFWFKRCALKGNVHAMYVLGFCFLYHNETPEREQASILWLRQAADQNSTYAHYELGRCYQNGWGVDKNYITAREHYNHCKKNSDNTEEVQQKLDELDELVWSFYEKHAET